MATRIQRRLFLSTLVMHLERIDKAFLKARILRGWFQSWGWYIAPRCGPGISSSISSPGDPPQVTRGPHLRHCVRVSCLTPSPPHNLWAPGARGLSGPWQMPWTLHLTHFPAQRTLLPSALVPQPWTTWDHPWLSLWELFWSQGPPLGG